ncbi:MAG: 2-amino-4-hydroxy-6-hydroxymethyldihydropteridine diphosphokinase [Congregibacter sp.]|nr:2-amino-4-hydroxy-6-hydroxymethyldihydropteridine diphosphokinase [Congregibacter sp.]
MTPCFVGLGANLGNSLRFLQHAAKDLHRLPATQVTGHSLIYRSAPLGPKGQQDYLNAVVALDTRLDALALLDALQALENKAGRERKVRWGPRTLDLDILLFGTMTLSTQRLTLPHPQLFERNFVLQPLADIVGVNWQFEDGSTLAQRLAACPDNDLRVTELSWTLTLAETLSA